jgi:hypothetical protein
MTLSDDREDFRESFTKSHYVANSVEWARWIWNGQNAGSKRMIIYQSRIYRADLRANPDVLYVFGDNAIRRGYGGQAGEMRGEPNARGVATKWSPGNHPNDYFSDLQYDKAIQIIDEDTFDILLALSSVVQSFSL